MTENQAEQEQEHPEEPVPGAEEEPDSGSEEIVCSGGLTLSKPGIGA